MSEIHQGDQAPKASEEVGTLTIIWDTEKRELVTRIEYLEVAVESLASDVRAMMEHLKLHPVAQEK